MDAKARHGSQFFFGKPSELTEDKRQASTSEFLSRATAALLSLRRLSVLVGLLIIWEFCARWGIVNGQVFPPPSRILGGIKQLAEFGLLWNDVSASILRVTIGFAFATLIGITLAAVLARVETLAYYIMPIVELIRPISVIAWIPIAILWFGLGDKPAWFIIFLGSFFPIFTNTYVGFRSVAPIHIQAAKCFGAGRWLFFRKVLFPSALPYILTGMRIGLGFGWMCVIAAEMIAATSGLGYMIQLARNLMETERIFAGMIIIGIVGFTMNQAMLWLERRLTPWRAET